MDQEQEYRAHPENFTPDRVEQIERVLQHFSKVQLFLMEELDRERSGILGIAGEAPTERDFSSDSLSDQ